jgi:hypothetical protein
MKTIKITPPSGVIKKINEVEVQASSDIKKHFSQMPYPLHANIEYNKNILESAVTSGCNAQDIRFGAWFFKTKEKLECTLHKEETNKSGWLLEIKNKPFYRTIKYAVKKIEDFFNEVNFSE